jgi:LPS sulfotransferase NodH
MMPRTKKAAIVAGLVVFLCLLLVSTTPSTTTKLSSLDDNDDNTDVATLTWQQKNARLKRIGAKKYPLTHDEAMTIRRRRHPNFLIICFPRVGSTVFSGALTFSGGVQSLAQEMVWMNVTAEGFDKERTHEAAHAQREMRIIRDYFRAQSTVRRRRCSTDLVGWNEKLAWSSLLTHRNYTHMLVDFLREQRFKLIFLERRNVIKQAVSIVRANELAKRCGTMGWNKQDTEEWRRNCGDAAKKQRDPIDKWHLNAVVTELDRTWQLNHAFARDTRLQTLRVYYEDLQADPAATLRAATDFLGATFSAAALVNATNIYRKQTPDSLRDVVPNYDELKTFFTPTKFASMFVEAPMEWR